MVEKDCNQDGNPSKPSNRSEKTLIKLNTTCIWLNKLEYKYINIKKKVFLNRYK